MTWSFFILAFWITTEIKLSKYHEKLDLILFQVLKYIQQFLMSTINPEQKFEKFSQYDFYAHFSLNFSSLNCTNNFFFIHRLQLLAITRNLTVIVSLISLKLYIFCAKFADFFRINSIEHS